MQGHRSPASGRRWPALSEPVRQQTIRQVRRRAREREIAIVLLIVLEAVEVLRRSPRWLLLLAAFAVGWLVLVVAEHIWLVDELLATLVGLKIARGVIEGWREHDDIPF
jgi:hypothetical protein